MSSQARIALIAESLKNFPRDASLAVANGTADLIAQHLVKQELSRLNKLSDTELSTEVDKLRKLRLLIDKATASQKSKRGEPIKTYCANIREATGSNDFGDLRRELLILLNNEGLHPKVTKGGKHPGITYFFEGATKPVKDSTLEGYFGIKKDRRASPTTRSSRK